MFRIVEHCLDNSTRRVVAFVRLAARLNDFYDFEIARAAHGAETGQQTRTPLDSSEGAGPESTEATVRELSHRPGVGHRPERLQAVPALNGRAPLTPGGDGGPRYRRGG